MASSELSEQQQAIIADRARVWEVRRFCQVLPSVVKYARGTEVGLTREPSKPHPKYSRNEPDGALASLLRCIVYQTGADLAMISLLDDHTQYFVSGASRDGIHDARVTLADSTKWYGCESVTHHGGLCERTITQQNHPGCTAIYEELDMAKLERTKDLPFVKGDIASFRHYAGIPLNPYNGPNIGTVFIFSSEPSEFGLSAANRSYLCEIASHITKHLEQAVEALEGKRLLRFNQGVASLLRIGTSVEAPKRFESTTVRPSLISNLSTDSALRLYRLAATLLYDAFEFDGVRILELGLSDSFINKNPAWNGSDTLAEHLGPDVQKPASLSRAITSRLLDLFPQGAVFQILGETGDVVAATSADDVAPVVDPVISTELPKAYPEAEQIVLMPLWDSFHERNIGAVLAFANGQSRVYLGSTDLSSISAFCTTIMTQVRRLEAQAMEKIKSDFLGSVSHELRTPLHGIMTSLELLSGTPHSPHQHDLLEIARYSGSSLLDTIEHILYFSNISSQMRNFDGRSAGRSEEERNCPSSSAPNPRIALPRNEDTVGIVALCEEVIQGEAQRLRLKETAQPEAFNHSRYIGSWHTATGGHAQPESSFHHPILVFDTNATWSCHLTAVTSFRAVFANLLNNALKFSEPTSCVRVSLDVDDTCVKLSCADTGKGVSPDFLRHSIFDPFSQEDPGTEGTGLGLSIVRQTVTMLNGDIRVDSSEEHGSTFTVTFPSRQLLLNSSEKVFNDASTPPGTIGLPKLEMSLYIPSRWNTGDTVRDERCDDMLLKSLSRGLGQWFQVEVTPWDSASTTTCPRLFFALQEDVHDAKNRCGDTLQSSKHIVLCPDVHATLSPRTTPSEKVTIVAGPVTVSKLQDALAHLFPTIISPSGLHDFPHQMPMMMQDEASLTILDQGSKKEENDDGRGGLLAVSLSGLELDSKQHAHCEDDLTQIGGTSKGRPPVPSKTGTAGKPMEAQIGNKRGSSNEMSSPTQPDFSAPCPPTTAEPKLLLVDDNAINLKVLSMYARKCSKKPAISVGGGQDAIDAFHEALASQPFDMIFLDLSMPHISGFDVAKTIRDTEARLRCRRTYICALTGLASGKDRNAAYASGVDNYLVRPTRLADLQRVIEIWRDHGASESSTH